jgi:hypothetical protein
MKLSSNKRIASPFFSIAIPAMAKTTFSNPKNCFSHLFMFMPVVFAGTGAFLNYKL